jgi:hypothetical protein
MPPFTWPTSYVDYQNALRGTSARKCRLFAVAWCRKWMKEIQNPDCRALVELAERYADGLVSRNQLRRRRQAVHRWAEAGWGTPGWEPSWAATWGSWNAAIEAIVPPCPGYANLDPNYADVADEVFGNLAEAPHFSPDWRTNTAVSLARQMYEAHEFGAMPILADALQDAGCDNDDVLTHCRDPQRVHVRGCWVVDLVLGKE